MRWISRIRSTSSASSTAALARIGLGVTPAVEPRHRDAEGAAQHRHRIVGLLRLDQLKHQLGR